MDYGVRLLERCRKCAGRWLTGPGRNFLTCGCISRPVAQKQTGTIVRVVISCDLVLNSRLVWWVGLALCVVWLSRVLKVGLLKLAVPSGELLWKALRKSTGLPQLVT